MIGVDVFNYGHIIGANKPVKFSAQGDESTFADGDKVKVAEYCLTDESFSEGWEDSFGEGKHTFSSSKMGSASAIFVPEGQSVVLRKFPSADVDANGKTADGESQVEHTLVGPIIISCMTDIGGGTDFNDQLGEIEVSKLPTCSSMNRDDGASAYRCGACKVGYTEDADGVCQKDSGIEPKYVAYGVVGLVALTVISALR